MRKQVIRIMAVLLIVVTLFSVFGGKSIASHIQLTAKEQVEEIELYPYLSFCGVGFYTYTVTQNELGQAFVKLLFDTPVHLEPLTYDYYDENETRESVHMAVAFQNLPEEYPYHPSARLTFLNDGTVIVKLTSKEDYQAVRYQFKNPLFSPLKYETVKAALEKKR